jgi:hypothetical protein
MFFFLCCRDAGRTPQSSGSQRETQATSRNIRRGAVSSLLQVFRAPSLVPMALAAVSRCFPR